MDFPSRRRVTFPSTFIPQTIICVILSPFAWYCVSATMLALNTEQYTLLRAHCLYPAGEGRREVFVYKLTLHRFHSILLLLHQTLSIALNDLPQSHQPFLHLLLSFSCKIVAVLVYCLQLKRIAAHLGTLRKQTGDLYFTLLNNPAQYLPHNSPLGRHSELKYHKIHGRHPPWHSNPAAITEVFWEVHRSMASYSKWRKARLKHRHCTKDQEQAPSDAISLLIFTQRSQEPDLSDIVSNAALQDT